jgi:Staphylococcal nuclease homologue
MERGLCLALLLAAVGLRAAAEDIPELYRVDLAGVGSCYDADLSLMLSGHVFAYLEPGAIEVYFPHPPAGIRQRERVVLLGDQGSDFGADASRYLEGSVLGRDVLLAFDATSRSPSGALLAYVYLPHDGTCVNLRLIRDGRARVGPPGLSFQFRSEFEMYEAQAKDKRRGLWR